MIRCKGGDEDKRANGCGFSTLPLRRRKPCRSFKQLTIELDDLLPLIQTDRWPLNPPLTRGVAVTLATTY